MKKLYFLVVAVFAVGSVNGQNGIADIPDGAFKNILLYAVPNNGIAKNLEGNFMTVDANNDGQLQQSEVDQIGELNLYTYQLYSLVGIKKLTNLKILECSDTNLTQLDVSFMNLETLECNNNLITSLNVTGVSSLQSLKCFGNQLSQLDLSDNNSLIQLYCSSNNLSSLDLTGKSSLKYFRSSGNNFTSIDLNDCVNMVEIDLSNNELTGLDVSNLSKLQYLTVYDNQIEKLFMKHGVPYGSNTAHFLFEFQENPIQYICTNENDVVTIQNILNIMGYNCTVNSYCSFIPGGISYTINGKNTLDSNNNGCDASDESIPNLKFNITNDTQTGSIIANESGEYSIPVQAGTHTITPALENPTFFNISPATASVTFPATTSPFTQNFCITPNGLHPDLEVAILPTTPARPGFDSDYKLIIKNKGNIQQSGSVSFAYNDAILDYIIAEPLFTTQEEGLLSWAFANLEPFETREINVTLNVNSPMETPAVNGDDVLTYTATITSDQTDELPLDNIFTLPQIVVNSFDPNDKTCLEGTAITPDMIGKYVHYMIRFENTGTFAAENIVVKDMIDTAKFDVSSLIALNGSHPYVTRITGNKVEFIFEGINLPFDDANNDGYVVFKIKTLPTLALGDSFSNTASIYFDFNHPIVTEPAVTTFAVLGTEDFVFNNYFTIYPNPTNGILNITSKQAIELQSISIYNVLGQMVVSVPNAKGITNVDVSSLSTGNYFIKVVSDMGTSNSKFIKK